MKKIDKSIIGLIFFLTGILFVSCGNLFGPKLEEPAESDDKTFLCISVKNGKNTKLPGKSRTIRPENYSEENFINISFSGIYENNPESDQNFEIKNDSFADFSKKIELLSGQWYFTLSAEYNGVMFMDTQSKFLLKGKDNSVSFTLKPVSDYGGCYITFTMNDTVDKVEVTLRKLNEAGMALYENAPLEISNKENQKLVTLAFSPADQVLSAGKYYVNFEFFANLSTNPEKTDYKLLNQYESYLIITEALITEATINIDLNQYYTITYQYKDSTGSTVKMENPEDFADEGGLIPFYYSKGSEITLPKPKRAGYVFLGWKVSGKEGYFTSIDKDTSGNLIFEADLIEAKVYVSGTGDDNTGDGSEANPFESVDKACEYIIANPDPEADWTIFIMGDVTGPHNSTKKAGERSYAPNDYGRSNIPETLTTEHAKSILLIGANETLDANDNPQDMIDRGLSLSYTSSDPTGTALAIFTEVPVTIKRLMITKGSNSLDCNNTTSGVHGGGIYIGTDSTVTLDDDTLIINNGYRSAGGVFNDGTLYMVGKAYIGDRTATTVANGDNFSNTGAWGAGLYNKGTVYLGTEEKDLEGGIFYNFGSTGLGGGIYSECGTIEMRSGEIAYNDGASQGGGVYIRAGTFNMTGGSIHHNSTGGSGGGVFVGTGATFNFSRGTISANWATNNGGGVYIDNSESTPGIMYMYGTAVVGDKNKTSAPTSKEGANATNGNGAGIYVNGYFYMGYSSYTSETAYETADLTDGGGIYYSYNAGTTNNQGGALYINGGNGSNSSDKSHARIRSGTIANNYAEKGGAAYISGSNTLLLGGNVKIPSGTDHKNDIRYAGSYRIFVEDTLASVSESDPIFLTPASTTGETYYTEPVIKLGNNYPTGKTLADVVNKFKLSPLTNTKNGIVTHWIIDVETGKAVQDKITFYVASNGLDSNTGLEGFPLPSISKVIDKINARDEADKDYVIEINGEILGPQTIADTSETETIKANSIYIKGKNTSSATLSDVINANLGENEGGSALTIDTKVPVTLYYIGITGGHGKEIGSGTDARIAGGGLYIRNNATVSLEGKTHIYENTNYYGSTTVSGAGGGIYVGENATLYISSSSVQVRENKGTHYGAGVYVADGAYVKISEAAIISNNSFDEHFKQNEQAVSTLGGGIYLANNATLEMTNGTVSGNTANTTGSALGRGNGVFVSGTASSPATFKMGKSACIGIENDIFLQNNVPITIISSLTTYSTVPGIITPENYPSTDSEEITLLTVVPGSSVSISSAASYLKITPQSISGGEKQYWYLNSTGKLAKQTGMGITVTINPGLTKDITVSVTQGGSEVQDSIHLTAGNPLTFTATEGFESYKWTLDGEEKGTSNTLTLSSTDTPSVGPYDLYLEAKDSNGKYYSYTAQIRVSGN